MRAQLSAACAALSTVAVCAIGSWAADPQDRVEREIKREVRQERREVRDGARPGVVVQPGQPVPAGGPIRVEAQRIPVQPLYQGVRIVQKAAVPMTVRSTELVGMEIVDAQGQPIGVIQDLMVDLKQNHVAYAAVQFDAFEGHSDNLYPVPLSAFELRSGRDGVRLLVMQTTPDVLKQAQPIVQQKQWPEQGAQVFLPEAEVVDDQPTRREVRQERDRIDDLDDRDRDRR